MAPSRSALPPKPAVQQVGHRGRHGISLWHNTWDTQAQHFQGAAEHPPPHARMVLVRTSPYLESSRPPSSSWDARTGSDGRKKAMFKSSRALAPNRAVHCIGQWREGM